MLSENGNGPVTLTNPERSRPHWPLGAYFRRSSLEHLQRNALIEFERQGQGVDVRARGAAEASELN